MGKNEEIQNTKIETFKVQLTSKNQELESSKQCVALNQERIAALEQSLSEQMTKASQEVLQIQNVATTAVQNATEKVKLEEKKKYEKLENEMKEIKLSNTKFIQTIQTIQSVQEEQKEQEKMASELQSQLQSQL